MRLGGLQALTSLARRLFVSFLTPGSGIEGRRGHQLIIALPVDAACACAPI